jgi:acyl-CoA thioesterase II
LYEQDTFTNAHRPWVFSHADNVPGAITMAQSALAAYQTVPEDFVCHSLQSNFLAAASRDKDLVYKVQWLSTRSKVVVRLVTVEQQGVMVVSTTVSFMKKPSSGV